MTTAQTEVPATADVRRGRVPGEPGVWIMILGDLIVFGVLFVLFMSQRGSDPDLFNRSQLTLHRAFGGVNTLVLVTSSLLVVLAVGAIRAGERVARLLLCGALACAGIFLVNKGIEWTALIADGNGLSSNSYFTYFFVMTGLHAAHVIFGAALLIAMVVLSGKDRLSETPIGLIESFGCYWHLIDILWLIIFPLLYLVH
ncbi:hypothetical protein BRW65_01255 [Mycobacterium paraffinicum]|uniref:Probable cytochrome c oxidase subunit 3 n=2 Tax=Mycobacterium paraffinicum TaxID=53378 RepID=A0A1Q4I291_9MYCO|nr:hypothetical protein BRW65_01255 [Mycobacterium paraffinicum]